jgi:cytidylate kinase
MASSTPSFTVAIDGPAASGKGTLARRLAAEFNLPYLDTGLTYRAVAAKLQQNGGPLDDEETAVRAARSLDLAALDREFLSDHEIGAAASRVAVMPGLRAELVRLQRDFAAKGAVMDGRDIGTVVCPDALVKLFVTADAEARATRRFLEMQARGGASSYDEILRDIHQRDERDSSRSVSPLKKAADAHLIDTTNMDIETAFLAAKTLILQAIGR